MTSLKKWFTTANSTTDDEETILLLDGGVSTHLRDLCDATDSTDGSLTQDWYPELWSSSLLMTPPGRYVVVQGHKDWLKAGTNILTTVTYQCHFKCKVANDTQMREMLQDGVQLARQAVDEFQLDNECYDSSLFVVASMGCYGAALADGSEYTGLYPNIQSEQDLVDFHSGKTLLLLQQNPDGIALETVPCVQECKAFIKLMKELRTQRGKDLPASWISLACRNGQELNDGSKVEDALEAIYEVDNDCDDANNSIIQAIGVNCCDFEHVLSLVKIIATFMAQKKQQQQSSITRGIIIYPNSGEEWDANAKTWKEGTGLRRSDLQDVFATKLMEAVDIVENTWKELLPTLPPPRIVLGGCCRTRPDTIRAIRKQVDQRQEQPAAAGATTKTEPTLSNNALTSEQAQRLARIMGRDADFDSQLGEIEAGLQDLGETQQQQGEAVKSQASTVERVREKTKK